MVQPGELNLREAEGIKTVRNGEHRILQLQLDLHGKSLDKIDKKLDRIIGADERSKMNFKLICIMIVAVLGVYAVVLM